MRPPRLLTLVLAALPLAAPAFAQDGAVLGRVLVDSNGLPLPAATVTLGGATATSDAEGRYVVFGPGGAQTIVVQAAGFTSVSRPVAVSADAAVLALDARLTPLAAPVVIDGSGGELRTASLVVTVPAGAVEAGTEFRVTALTGQGLPARLPLGWTPTRAWDLRAAGAVTASLSAQASDLPDGTLHLVRHRDEDQAWVMVQSGLTPTDGQLMVELAQPGAYALVAADAAPAPPIPGPGAVLAGVAAVTPAGGLIGSVRVEPPLASSSGGIGRAFLRVESPAALPSGTVFQVRLEDDYLVDGEPVFEEPRVQDAVLYRAQPASGSVLEAMLPVRAVQSFPAERVVSGWVHVELWTRDQEAGGVLGGADAATLESGGFRLEVAAGSLPANTLLRLLAAPLSPFVPSGPEATALGEVVLDLSGATLETPAELSLAAPGLGPGDVVVIARVERFDVLPFLQVVSLAQVVNGRAVSVPHSALPGILTGGRYVFFKLAGPVGFVRGTLSTASGPVRAVARSATLPFAALSPASGSYTLTAAVGSVAVTGFIPRTTYQATATIAVTAGQISPLDLTLSGSAVTVTVTPADGATGLPVNTMVEIVASAPLGPGTVTTQNVRLYQGAPGGTQVPVHLVLSQANKRVAVIPDAPLLPSTLYTLQATGLRDAQGAAVAVPDTAFTTRSDEAPSYDLDRLTFSFPDEEGMVQVAATPGSFPPGSLLMIVNYGNQVVLTLTVDNDGAVSGTLPATLDDAMMVTLTDPDGRTLTKNVSRYVDAATGRTAIGVFGGNVDGPGGLQLRLPEGAAAKGIVFKLEDVPPVSIPPDKRPDIPGATLSSAVRITSDDKPTFRKEVDLVFPKPADAPAGAFFYVYRQLLGPNGTIVYQTIDKGVVEGDRVITASPPFSGYVDSAGSYSFSNGQAAVTGVANNIATLMWTHDSLVPGRALAAVFSGRVTRARWDPQTRTTVYDPVRGALVRRVQTAPEAVDPYGDAVSRTGDDGTYTFFDSTFTAGLATVRATDLAHGQTLDATAYATTKPPWAEPFRALAMANVAFPALQEPLPAPTVVIEVLVQKEGAWQPPDPLGIVVAGTPLAIGFNPTNGSLRKVEIDGVEVGIRPGGPEYQGMPHVADHVASQAGVHTITAWLAPPAGPDVSRTAVFLVVAEGGGNDVPLPGPPRVLRTLPEDAAANVAPDVLPQVFFTEPVTNVVGGHNLTLIDEDSGRAVAFTLSGTGPDGPIPALVPGSVVTSLTLQPAGGLRYSTRHVLRLTESIVDRDEDVPKPLVAYEARFKTFAPGGVGQTEETFGSPAIVAMGDRTFLIQNLFQSGVVRTYDVTDPAHPREVAGAHASVAGRPVDLGGIDGETNITGGRLIAAGTTATNQSLPSNVHLFDAHGDRMVRVGVASLTSSAVEGTLVRFVPWGRYLYALTQNRGVQVLDMLKARQNYAREAADPQRLFNMISDLNTNGKGFGHDAVVRTVPVKINETAHWILSDLDVSEYLVDGVRQPLAAVTGQLGLGVVNTQSGQVAAQIPAVGTPDGTVRLVFGRALALGRVGAYEVAVVAGPGTVEGAATSVLFTIDMANPLAPRVMGAVALTRDGIGLAGTPTDVRLREGVAIVAGPQNAVLVNLANPNLPALAGSVSGVAGRLAEGEDGILFSTAQGALGGSDPMGGLHAARIDQCDLLRLDTLKVEVDLTRDPIAGTLCGRPAEVVFRVCRPARVTLTVGTQPATAALHRLLVDPPPGPPPLQPVVDVPLEPGLYTAVLDLGTLPTGEMDPRPFSVKAVDVDSGVRDVESGTLRNNVVNRAVLPVGRTFVKGVDLFDGHVVRQARDVALKGRHLGLEMTRSYSSAGRSGQGAMGAGWSWNFESRIVEGSCGLWTVITADGSSQTFRSTDLGQTFTRQPGYHTKLERRSDQLVFTDKAGTEHFFSEQLESGRWRLEYVRDPHGDRIVPRYDASGRVVEVWEVGSEDPTRPLRSLKIGYHTVAGQQRIVSITSDPLKVKVVYSYDELGNLRSVRREDLDAHQSVTESYEYSVDSTLDWHQLRAVVDANGGRTEYAYYLPSDTFPGEGGAVLVRDKDEYAKEVREFPGATGSVSTGFVYDVSESTQARWKTTVTDARGNPTLYVLNGNGSPLRIEELPGDTAGRVTQMTWATADIFKTQEIDPNGRVTDYEYDDNGNLETETIHTTDLGDVVTRYEYDQRFNKLTRKVDAEAGETLYAIDPQTGDVTQATDAEGNVTRYVYDPLGRLERVTSPRGHATTHGEYDPHGYGLPMRTVLPEGVLQQRAYDVRGRVTREWDSQGHETQYGYDGFDRLRSKRRLSGREGSDDEVTTFEYYPGGQPRAVTNAKGLRTSFELDGMNRVVATALLGGGVPAATVVAEYDGNGNKEYETDGRGVRRHFVHDELNRLRRIDVVSGPAAAPTGEVATFMYDPVGNKTLETDVAGAATRFEYDGLYRVKEKILPETPYRETSTYDKVGNRRSSTDANGHTTQYVYDKLGRVTRTENAAGHVTTVTYLDAEGSKVNKAQEHDQTRGLRTTFRYDEQDREIERKVHLEGEDGVPGPGGVYTTTTEYEDSSHAVMVTLQPDRATRTVLDGLDRPVEQIVDPGGLNLRTETSFDGLGNRKRTVDPGGHQTIFEHDGLGRLVATRDDAGQETRVAFDAAGLKLWERDRREVRKDFTYDNLGRPTRVALQPSISGVAWSQETDYLDREFKRIDRDALGTPTTSELDRMGRVKRVVDFYGDDVNVLWDGVNKREETDKRGNTTRYEYDAVNRLKKVTDPAPFQAQTLQTTYDDINNRKTETDRDGVATVTQMDPMGRVLTVTRAEALLEAHTYDEAGNRLSSKDGAEKETRFSYDRANRLSSRTDGYGTAGAATTTYEYADRCNQTSERDQRAADLGSPFSVKREFDGLHRLVKATDSEGLVTEYGYDDEGHETRVREPEGQETQFAYDELGKLTSVTQPPPPGQPTPVTRYEYDPARNAVTQTDARGKVVRMTYDKLNRLDLRKQDEGGLNYVTNHDYDKNGNLERLTDPRSQVVTSTYDELNRLDTKTYAFASGNTYWPWRHTTSIEYDYDPNGNPTEIRESVASGTDPPVVQVTSRTYDDFNRLLSETTPLPDGGTRQVSYTYWGNGARKTVTDPAGPVTSYTYDGQNRLETATTAAGVTSYTYWPDDLLKTVTYPTGVVATHGYDKADRLTLLENTKDAAVLSSYAYTYWPNGNRKTQVEVNGGVTETTSYTYDPLNRLKTITYPADATYPDGRVVTYGYDSVGNRERETTRKPDGSLLADKQGLFDNVNRLTRLDDLVDPAQSIAFAYDQNGNQTSKTVGSTVTEYRYDVRDRMVETVQGQSILGRFQYDFDGRRTKKIGEEGVRQYVYDQTSLLLEYDENGNPKAKYDYGSDRLISLTRPDEGRRFFSFDGLRTVVNLSNDAGAAVANYHVDAWGNFRFPSELLASKNRFAFTGYIWDKETSLFFAKARFYDPEVGRFTSQDSYLGQIDDPPSLHRYFYANANPVRYIDPTGHQSIGAEFCRAYTCDASVRHAVNPVSQVADGVRGFVHQVGNKAAFFASTAIVHLWNATLGNGGHGAPPGIPYPEPRDNTEAWLGAAAIIATDLAPAMVPAARRSEGGVRPVPRIQGQTVPPAIPAESGLSMGQKTAVLEEGAAGSRALPAVRSAPAHGTGAATADPPRIVDPARLLAAPPTTSQPPQQAAASRASVPILPSQRGPIYVTPQGVAVTSETLAGQGTSPQVGDFRGLAGATVDEVVSRVPSRWSWAPQDKGQGIKFVDPNVPPPMGEGVRMHGPSSTAPPGSNSASGWTLRLMDFQGNYYDALGKIVGHTANEGHIPLRGNPSGPTFP